MLNSSVVPTGSGLCNTREVIQIHCTLRFMINRGGQNKRGGFKDFEKLINGGVKISRGVGTKYKRKKTKIGLSLLTLLNIGIFSILRSRIH